MFLNGKYIDCPKISKQITLPKKINLNQSKRILVKIFFNFFHRFEVSILRICESVVLLNLDRNVDYKMM